MCKIRSFREPDLALQGGKGKGKRGDKGKGGHIFGANMVNPGCHKRTTGWGMIVTTHPSRIYSGINIGFTTVT